MLGVIGLLVNDSIAAAVISVALTAQLTLIGWIVSKLSKIDVKVENHDVRLESQDERIQRLEYDGDGFARQSTDRDRSSSRRPRHAAPQAS